MPSKHFFILPLFFLTLINRAQSFDSLCLQQQLVLADFTSKHISPPEFNSQTFSEILELYIDQADPRHIFLFQSDVEKLQETIKSTASSETPCKLIEQSYAIFSKRKLQIDSIISKIESSPLTFSNKDTIRFFSSRSKWVLCNNLSDLNARLLRRIKYDCLALLAKPLKENEDVNKLPAEELNKRQTACKKKAIVRLKRYLEAYGQDVFLGHHIADALSNAIALRCDPHSSYFNSWQKEQFEASLSTEEYSFGFYASENENGEIIIGELIPGGPAWKSARVHEGDVILSFLFTGETAVELEFSDIDDFYDSFYKSQGKQVELKLRKKDNQIVTVPLKKQKIQSQENLMNSYVLTEINEAGIRSRIGYISIPSFYTDEDGESRLGCANDVAKEIIKLKDDSIEGLILDLRYNGGGSMEEAMGLSGIFIDEGPLAIYKAKNDKPRLLKDFNRGSIYDGPLVLLVNSGSASASEFLTATLRDYNRAVIVGSTTYGKGTSQIILPADTNLYKLRGKKAYYNPSLGFAKITVGKFYGVTAQTHQGKGIEPHIHIPDLMEKISLREASESYYLPADSVTKKVVFNKQPDFPITSLKEKSGKRINSESKFSAIRSLADSLKRMSEMDEKLTLTLEGYTKYYDRSLKLSERIEEVMKREESGFNVRGNSFIQKLTEFDEYQKKINEQTIDGLKTDIILYEAFSITRDIIGAKK